MPYVLLYYSARFILKIYRNIVNLLFIKGLFYLSVHKYRKNKIEVVLLLDSLIKNTRKVLPTRFKLWVIERSSHIYAVIIIRTINL